MFAATTLASGPPLPMPSGGTPPIGLAAEDPEGGASGNLPAMAWRCC